MAYVKQGFILPNVNDPYVYLKTLKTDNNYMANVTGENARICLSEIQKSLEKNLKISEEGKMDASLSFLNSVANAQQKHEMAFIKHNMEIIAKSGDGETQDRIKKLLESLTNPDTFNYAKFIDALNESILGLERYEQRLEGLKNNQASYKEGEPHNVDALRNVTNDFNATIGTFTNRRSEFNYSQEELTRQLTLEFFNTPVGQDILAKLITNKEGVLDFAAISLVIQTELTQFLYDNKILIYTDKLYKDETEFLKELGGISERFDDFINQYNIKNITSNSAILQDVRRLYGITLEEKDISIRGENTQKAKEAQRRIESIRRTVKNPLDQYKDFMSKGLKRLRVDFKGEHKVGLDAELKTLLANANLGGRHMGKFNTGTDVLLGQIVTSGLQPIRDPTLQTINDIHRSIDENHAANKVRETTDIYEKAFEQCNEMIQVMDGIKHGFILHETTKYYQTVEKGTWYKGKKGFHGREMAIFNYIDAIAEFGMAGGVNTQWLKFAAYNLAKGTIGREMLKDPLTNYFAIAAGLIMFDDFGIIAKEITKELNYSTLDVIHLYNLQGLYFPASYFLRETYNALTQSKEDLANNNRLKTYISTPKITYARDKSKTMQEQWDEIKDQGSNVHVNIVFAMNFLDLVGKLLN